MSSAAASPSPFVGAVRPITETDAEIAEALLDAELPPLLPALAYLTGDLSLLEPGLRPDPLMTAMPQAGLTDEQQARIRDVALRALARYRDGGCVPALAPTEADLLRILEFTVGGVAMAEYLPLLEEELAFRGEDRRAPQWRIDEVAPGVAFSVLIIGAGMSGILAAHRLKQAGVDFTIVDKNPDVGGTWFENTYPGCRVDNPNHNYSYSFAQRHDWPYLYSTHDVLHGYLRDCADAFGLGSHLRLGVEVRSATWSDADQQWAVEVQRSDGGVETITANAVVSAVGQLNRPMFPDIAGHGSFTGPSFHSARWDHGVDLTGRRVGVIGTGASAVQFLPEIAPRCGEVLVFQRTPPWTGPTPDYHDPVPSGRRWLYGKVPSYSELHRFAIFWRMGDGALASVRVDPSWDRSRGSVSAGNEMARQLLTEYMRSEFAARPDLIPHVIPTYPPGAKRGLRDNGVWARTLTRDNVRLIVDPIEEITATGIRTREQGQHDVDVLIYGTGFQASNFLAGITVTGRGGVDLHEQWAGDARAYLGVTIPGFPNLFCLYGPNTNIVVNGSIVYFSECGVRYLVDAIKTVLASGRRSIDVKRDVHDEFNERVDAENRLMAWGVATVSSWYRNAHGHVAQNWPFTLLEYWQRTLRVEPADYDLRG